MWDYPRPPRVEQSDRHVVIEHRGIVLADTRASWRVLETSQPPAYYLPPEDIAMQYLRPARGQSFCEWKGMASYFDVVVDDHVAAQAAWSYPTPNDRFAAIRDHVAFYPQRVDACFVDSERVQANDGDFYGGWITSGVVGPFKGGAGTLGW